MHRGNSIDLASRLLGAGSLAIGLTEIAAPKQVQQVLGVDEHPQHRGILGVLGIREIMHGLGLLSRRPNEQQATSGLPARVAGDVLDAALLAIVATRTRRPARFAAIAATVAAIGILDVVFARRAQHSRHRADPR